MKSIRTAAPFSALAFAALVACGSHDASTDGADAAGNQGDIVFGNGSTIGAGTNGASCAGTSVSAKEVPVYLVFMFDKSGSMGNDPDGGEQNYDKRWAPCSSALKSFLQDGRSKGLSATLDFFPSSTDENVACSTSYATTSSALRSLPEAPGAGAGSLTAKLASVAPDGTTPTLPALNGAIRTAQDIRANVAAKNGGKVAIVLVTDGEPNGCSGNSVTSVANAAKAVRNDIPTYVIGVGNVKGLNTIATAGDPLEARPALIVNPTPAPGQKTTADQFIDALGTIRGSALGCDYALPAPPAGKTLDIGSVNVVYTKSGGAAATLPYDKDCAGAGWRYDNPKTPKRISLCKASCDTVVADSGATIDIQLGCQTAGTNGQIPN